MARPHCHCVTLGVLMSGCMTVGAIRATSAINVVATAFRT
jgi:hypothetical protein